MLPGLRDGLYTDWSWEVVPIDDSHCRELIDNVVDMAHFYYVHFSFPTSFRNVFEGNIATQYMESKGRPDMAGGYGSPDLFLKSEATYYGPAYMINWLTSTTRASRPRSSSSTATSRPARTPSRCSTASRSRSPRESTTTPRATSRKKYAEMFGEGFLQDVHIWKNKVPVQNPLLCEEDGPVYQLRRWYEQFYVDKADIVPEMVDRFEFEVDTTKANEYWQEEVAENLRLQAEEEAGGDQQADSSQIMTGT